MSPAVPAYREATAMFVSDLLKAGKPREEVQEIINRMTEAEKTWWTKKLPEQMPLELRGNPKAPPKLNKK